MKSRMMISAMGAVGILALGASGAQAATDTFTKNELITFSSAGTTPIPSALPVSAVAGDVTKVTVALDQYSMSDNTEDTDIVLQGPGGQQVMLMSDAGGGLGTGNKNIVFDDAAVGFVSTPIVNAAFKPTNFDTTNDNNIGTLTPPFASTLSVFDGSSANGTWNLFIRHASFVGSGNLPSWSLTITSEDAGNPPPPGKDLTLNLTTSKQKLARKLLVVVEASEAGELKFSGKARGSVSVEKGTSEVDARLDPGAFKKLKKKVKRGKPASVVVEASLKADSGGTVDDLVKVKIKKKK